MRNTDQLKMSEYVVLYIDFLGMKEKMLSGSEKTLKTLFKLFHSSMRLFGNLSTASYDDVKARIFSDNIVIVFRKHMASDERQTTICDIADAITFSVFFQTQAIREGLFIRGAITIGDMYCDNVFVFGPALIKAYELENKKAIFPRIIIDECVITELEKDENTKTLPEDFICISTDNDGAKFIDFLSVRDMHVSERNEIIKCGFREIENILRQQPDEKIKEKLNWLIAYFLRYKNTNPEK